MEREITLSSFSVKGKSGNRPGDFTIPFTPPLELDNSQGKYYLVVKPLRISNLHLEFGITEILIVISEKRLKQ